MAVTTADHAPRVCTTCKARKKQCDKALPQCGYCTKRSLICVYQESPTNDHTGPSTRTSLDPEISVDRGVFYEYTDVDSLGQRIHNFLFYKLHGAGQSIEQFCQSFFQGFHAWLPVISPRRLESQLSKVAPEMVPADLAVLLLAMLLVTSPRSSEEDAFNRCVAAKTVMGQVQAVYTASIPLVQAGLLISSFEYAWGRSDAATITMAGVIRQAQILQLDSVVKDAGSSDMDDAEQGLERNNIWWGLVILERLISIETQPALNALLTDFPPPDRPLPVDLEYREQVVNVQPVTLLGDIDDPRNSEFGRQAQAAHFLHQALQITNDRDGGTTRSERLQQLSSDMLSLLTNQMRWSGKTGQRRFSAMGTIFRSLLFVHQALLTGSNDDDVLVKDAISNDFNSLSALDSVTRMISDVLHDHIHHSDDLWPICVHNVRAARLFLLRFNPESLNNLPSLEPL